MHAVNFRVLNFCIEVQTVGELGRFVLDDQPHLDDFHNKFDYEVQYESYMNPNLDTSYLTLNIS